MLCYRDMTFCQNDCAQAHCPRKLTPEVERNAARWWGKPDAPIAISDFKHSCPDYTPGSRV